MKKYLFMLVVMLSVAVGAVAQDIMEVTGTITDTKGEPLIGAPLPLRIRPDWVPSPTSTVFTRLR